MRIILLPCLFLCLAASPGKIGSKKWLTENEKLQKELASMNAQVSLPALGCEPEAGIRQFNRGGGLTSNPVNHRMWFEGQVNEMSSSADNSHAFKQVLLWLSLSRVAPRLLITFSMLLTMTLSTAGMLLTVSSGEGQDEAVLYAEAIRALQTADTLYPDPTPGVCVCALYPYPTHTLSLSACGCAHSCRI